MNLGRSGHGPLLMLIHSATNSSALSDTQRRLFYDNEARRLQRRMAQVNVIGRITADLELKTSEKSNPYVRFDIAENIGSRQTLHTQYFQVCAWGEDANRLMKAHAKKGSLKVI